MDDFETQSLAEFLASIVLTAEECMPDFDDTTVDDFYDFVEIPMEARSDFCTGILLEQSQKYF